MSFFESKGWRVTSKFGPRTHPLKKTTEFHKGIDLVKPHQSPVPSFTDGVVTHAKTGVGGSGLGSYGITVTVVEPGTGYLHVYAHLDSATVKLGQKVKAGDILGTQGNTGASAGSHLHYEIRKKSTPAFGYEQNTTFVIDPAVYWKDEKYIGNGGVKPVATPTPKPAAVKPATPKTHTVEFGDTLYKIAMANKTSVDAILAKNPQIKDKNNIEVGSKIKL